MSNSMQAALEASKRDLEPVLTVDEYIKKCKLQPIWGRVIVKPLKIEETDEQFKNSKLYIPETTKKKEQRAQQHAYLVRVDTDSFRDWHGTIPKVGQKVLIDKYVGFHVKSSGIEYRMMNDDQIVAIVEE